MGAARRRDDVDELGVDQGHDHLREVRRIAPQRGQVDVGWSLDRSPTTRVEIPEGFAVYTAVADGNPNGRPLGVLLVRGVATEATVTAHFTTAD